MRDPKRIKRILKKIEVLWTQVPDQRLGQFLENYVFGHTVRLKAGGLHIFHVEDDEMESALDARIATWKRAVYGE